jgi:cytochrome c oxidase assembly factor CtaG
MVVPLADGIPVAGPGIVASILVAGLAALFWVPYRRRATRLARTGRPVPGWRQWCYAGGLVVLIIALTEPLGVLAEELLYPHMIEHLMIGDIAALLIVLGLTGPLIAPLLRIHWISRLRVLTHPLVALPVWAISLYVWHLPVLYQAALRSEGVHAFEHACFLVAGIAMWMALLGPLPKPAWFGTLAMLGYVIAVRLIEAILGNIFLWSHTTFYPYYRVHEATYHISPLQDQINAGAVMMVEGSILTIILFGWLFMRAASQYEERQRLIEYAQAHDLELDEARAARAVAAGRGDELLRRLEQRVAAVPPRPAVGGPAGAPRET